jgi:uncharacterized membrane protein YhhN
MTTTAWAFGVVASAFIVADWSAVWFDRRAARRVTKPAALVALVVVALTLVPVDPTIRTVMVVGLVLSLAGDVFLLDERWFVAGLGAFLLGHLAYVAALQMAPTSWSWLAVGLVGVLASVALVGRPILGAVAAGDHGELTVPVVAYLVVISVMVISAFGTASAPAILGAGLFYVSDTTLAWNRFVEARRSGPLAAMVTYHLGQAGLVGWVATG